MLSSVLAAPASAEEPDTSQWFVGAYYRHAWVPNFMLKPFFERAPGVSNDGFGSHRLALEPRRRHS